MNYNTRAEIIAAKTEGRPYKAFHDHESEDAYKTCDCPTRTEPALTDLELRVYPERLIELANEQQEKAARLEGYREEFNRRMIIRSELRRTQ